MTELAALSVEQDLVGRVAQAERDLDLLQQQLQHSHRLATVGTLAAGVAHEINNIMTPVLAYAQLAKADPHDAALQVKALDRAIAGAESAARIAQAVLGFTRTDDDLEHANVYEAIDAALACLARDPSKDGTQLDISVDPAANVRIPPLALQHVLLNLILNAVTAMRPKRGSLRISVAQHADGSTWITLADTGPGIPRHLLATLFEPFVTSPAQPHHSTAADPATRSGLGLAVCRRLVENVGGSIEARSNPGEGAAFTIALPTFDRPNPKI